LNFKNWRLPSGDAALIRSEGGILKRSRFSGGVKDLPLHRLGAQAKIARCPICAAVKIEKLEFENEEMKK
jgi:hypothetical protein